MRLNRSGFTKMYRSRWDNPLFRDQKLCRLAAWEWLIDHAAWRDTTQDVGGRTISVKKGQLCFSLRQLAAAWRWSEPAVRRFLTRLKSDAMIDAETDAGKTLITICNYEKFQDLDDGADAASDAGTDAVATQQRRTKGRKKEDKNNPPTPQRGGSGGDPPPAEAAGAEPVPEIRNHPRVAPQTVARLYREGGAKLIEFLDAYPKWAAPDAAIRAWKARMRDGIDPQTLVEGARRERAYVEARAKREGEKSARQYTPAPGPWLNAGRWEDDRLTNVTRLDRHRQQDPTRAAYTAFLDRRTAELRAEGHDQGRADRLAVKEATEKWRAGEFTATKESSAS